MSLVHDDKSTTQNATFTIDNDSNVTSESTPDIEKTNEGSVRVDPSVNSAKKCVHSESTNDLSIGNEENDKGALGWVLHEGGGCTVSWRLPEGSTTPKDYIALCGTGEFGDGRGSW